MPLKQTLGSLSERGYGVYNIAPSPSNRQFTEIFSVSPSALGYTNFNGLLSMSGDTNYIAFGTEEINPDSTYGNFWIYKYSAGTYNLEYTPGTGSVQQAYFASGGALNNDGSYFAMVSPGQLNGSSPLYNLKIYNRVGTTWSIQYNVNLGFGMGPNQNYNNTVGINSAGDTVAIRNKTNLTIYTRSGSTWTQQASITNALISSLAILQISDNGDYVSVGRLIYKRTGTSWALLSTQSTSINAMSGDANYINLNNDNIYYPIDTWSYQATVDSSLLYACFNYNGQYFSSSGKLYQRTGTNWNFLNIISKFPSSSFLYVSNIDPTGTYYFGKYQDNVSVFIKNF